MSQPQESGDGVWRDEQRLPLSELNQAMASYSADGQVDDVTGHDAGSELEYGHGATPDTDASAGDPDPDSAQGRALRPSPHRRLGPH